MTSLLEVENLEVRLLGGAPVVEGISFSLSSGQVFGVVGESGSGKTTLGLALLGYSRPGMFISTGRVSVDGTDLLSLPTGQLRRQRGALISYVPQDSSKALNPSVRLGDQIRELMDLHLPGGSSLERVESILQRVSLPAGRDFLRRFPHQLSGGQQQRMTLAMALACDPKVVVFDEPTTGLDVITQGQILAEVTRLCRDADVAAVFVSHDMAAVAAVATHTAVMYAGRIVEQGPVRHVIAEPLHPYTAALVASIPSHKRPSRLTGIPGTMVGVEERPTGCSFAARCPLVADNCRRVLPDLTLVGSERLVRCLRWESTPPVRWLPRSGRVPPVEQAPLLQIADLHASYGRGSRRTVVVHGVSLAIRPGECLALVGESGSGKSTIARCIAGLHRPTAGELRFDGHILAGEVRERPQEFRRRIQIVFQSPYDSLNPTVTIADSIARPLRLFHGLSTRASRVTVTGLLEQVRLPARLADRYPGELSGGERQRVAIARALAGRPDLLLCDEVTSSLDVSVQAAVLSLLDELRRDLNLSMLFVTHDLGIVASIADRVIVLEEGLVVEEGAVENVLSHPKAGYTERLIKAIPELPASPFEATAAKP